ncbi:hypothetical protein Q5752_003853 [Cryptotrichosporon argae]
MSVKPEDAEEYELPELNATCSLQAGPDTRDDAPEHAPLLDDGKPRRSGDGVFATPADDASTDKITRLIAQSVPSTDDPHLPTLTLRTLLLGSFFCVLGAAASQVFYFKSNAPSFSSYFVILLTYPLGHGLANEHVVARGRRVWGINLNPGPFSIKEAILVSVIASSGAMSAYAADILAILDLYYKVPLSTIPSIILLLTTQCIGFGMAGTLQNLLVSPPAMYWPSTLVTVQLFTTLYTSTAASSVAALLTKRRLNVFLALFLATFIYQFFPFLLFPTLTSVSLLCLANNESWWMRTLGGAYRGLGMLDFSFDWSSIGSSGPLYTPFWALGNWFGGLIGMVWVIVPIMLVLNFWHFPGPLSAGLYNSTFQKFDVTSVLNADLSLNVEAYDAAKPLLLTPYFAISYAMSFAALSSVLVHVWIWHRHEIREALSNRAELNDTHNKLMRAYLSVPSSWYMGLLVINLGAAILMMLTAPLQMPIWALLLSLIIAAIFLVPIGIIAAVSNTVIGLNVMTEFVAGFLMPGKPIGNVTFKCFGYMAMSQALQLTNDLKLGWYMSIPPREMFACQIIGTVLGALTNYITLISVLNSKRDYLDNTLPDPTGQWTGLRPQIFYSASIIWGAVSPARFFSGKYAVLYLGFVVGAVVPIGCWFAHKRWPGRKFDKVVFPIICNGASTMPEYPSNIILTGVATAVFVHAWFAKRFPRIHEQYIFVVSSALDAGTSVTALAIYVLFGGVIFTWNGPNWWGNSRIDSEHCIPGS